jgi:hypothetical protein
MMLPLPSQASTLRFVAVCALFFRRVGIAQARSHQLDLAPGVAMV